MAVSDDDVGVVPVPVAAPAHVPEPAVVGAVGPRLRDVRDAEFVLGRDDLQRRRLLPGALGLVNGHVEEGPGRDVREVLGRPAEVLVLVEGVDEGGGPGGVAEGVGVALVAVEGDGDAHARVVRAGVPGEVALEEVDHYGGRADDGEDGDDSHDGGGPWRVGYGRLGRRKVRCREPCFLFSFLLTRCVPSVSCR